MAAQARQTPKDALVIMAILKDMGVTDYESRVVNQLLEFMYRYVTNILDDARVYANHAKKKNIDGDDVKLAVQMQMDRSFTTPPPRDILLEVSRSKNSVPLPLIKPHCGIHLPPDRYCLSACNYRMKTAKRPNHSSSSPSTTMLSAMQRGAPMARIALAKPTPKTGAGAPKIAPKVIVGGPKPVIKVTPGAQPVKPKVAVTTGAVVPTSGANPVAPTSMLRMELDAGGGGDGQGVKRKRQDDDYAAV